MFYLLHYFLPGFEGFTDYRCFHVCKKAVTFEGVTKEVGVVECKPDAASPTWGDTSGVPGKSVLLGLVVCDFFLKVFSEFRYFPPADDKSPPSAGLRELVE